MDITLQITAKGVVVIGEGVSVDLGEPQGFEDFYKAVDIITEQVKNDYEDLIENLMEKL
ncbi:coil containing protein [Vibrio phage 1.084.O._10N.261.49.F5]|nr:coil containing protein [Vibrio phage 1.084.O._10N.261.49.F5]